MAHIRNVADSASAAASDISRTLLEQKEATGQIARDAEQVACMTAASSQTVESMTSTAAALRRLAGDMQTLVSGFKT
jgi:methyl-accepting chemotaxis protein